MTTRTIKLIVFIILLVHGIGHLQGVVSSTGIKFNKSTSTISWLLKSFGAGPNRILCLVLYLAAGVMGILTALCFYGIVLQAENWQNFALVTACISAAGLFLFPNALAMVFNKTGAVAVNLIIFYSILFNGNWPSAVFDNQIMLPGS